MESKVSLIKCGSYNADKVFDSVSRAVALIGGMNSFISPGATVLIKPNLLSAKPPESGVDTHPEVVRAVIKMARNAGATVAVGDSPGGSVKKMRNVYEVSGMGRICREEGAKLESFDSFEMVKGFPVAKAVLDSDVLISVPKFKTHSLMTLTAAVKNTFGAVPGLFKTECHKRAPDPRSFAATLVDIYDIVKPELTVLDAVVSMEGEGPSSAGTLRHTGFVSASGDAVSMDAVLAVLMGLSPGDILTTAEAARRGLGNSSMECIEIIGGEISEFSQENFKLPRGTVLHRVPGLLLRSVASLMKTKPAVNQERCRRCGICVEGCPTGAISLFGEKITFDYKKCILCLCCYEFCPHNAVYIKENLLNRILRG